MSKLSRAVMLLFLAVVPGLSGCEPAAAPATGAAQAPTVLDASQVERRGALPFVRGWELGRRIAAQRQQPCLVFFTADWCTYCKRMEETTFCDPAVVQSASQFVCVLVDADAEPEVCQRLQVSGYPTVELVSPTGTSLGRMTGWQPAPRFLHSLEAALHRYAWLEHDAAVR
ncbi:MAG TPA: thioredoxin family protein [Lacipirellula sp.]